MSQTDEILQSLQKFRENENPSMNCLQYADYSFYITAPYWLHHQTVCLLADIPCLDEETFYTLISFRELELKINRVVYKSCQPHQENSNISKLHFRDYVMRYFPIPHSKVYILKNLDQHLRKAIETGVIKLIHERINGVKTNLLDPLQVINWAIQNNITSANKLQEHLPARYNVDKWQLPKIFPDTICFNIPYNRMRIEYNTKIMRVTQPLNTPISTFPSPREELKEITTEELALPLTQFLMVFVSPRGEVLSKIGREQLKKRLQENPVRPHWLKRETLSPQEAILIYYNISPDIFDDIFKDLRDMALIYFQSKFIKLLDMDEGLFENYLNYLFSKNENQIPSQILVKDFINFLIEKRCAIPAHLSLALNLRTSPEEIDITPRGKQLLECATNTRKSVIELALEFEFPDDRERAPHLGLIESIGNPSIEEFKKYKAKGPTPATLENEHKCRALAKLLKHLHSELNIKGIKQYSLMQKLCGHVLKQLKGQRTFNTWMNTEGIRDREKKS